MFAVVFLGASPAMAANHRATKAQLIVIKKAFSDRLKDPYSMKLKNVKIADDGSMCGEVNAKNSYGAYTGYTTFIGMYFNKDKNGHPVTIILKVDDGDSTVAQTMCTEKGM